MLDTLYCTSALSLLAGSCFEKIGKSYGPPELSRKIVEDER